MITITWMTLHLLPGATGGLQAHQVLRVIFNGDTSIYHSYDALLCVIWINCWRKNGSFVSHLISVCVCVNEELNLLFSKLYRT